MMTMGLAWTAIAVLFAALGMGVAEATPVRSGISVPDNVTEVDDRRHRHHGHRRYYDHHRPHHRPYWGYRPSPGYFQPPPYYYPRYAYPPRYYYPPPYYDPGPGFYFHYRN